MDLNSRYSTVDRLRVESNPKVLAALTLDWLEHLKAPVLTKEELSAIVVRGEKPEICLRKFDVVRIKHCREKIIRLLYFKKIQILSV
jgi:hypothetical protein